MFWISSFWISSCLLVESFGCEWASPIHRLLMIASLAQNKESMMLEIYYDRIELVQNIFTQYPVYFLLHAVRDFLKVVHDQNLPIRPPEHPHLNCCLSPPRSADVT